MFRETAFHSDVPVVISTFGRRAARRAHQATNMTTPSEVFNGSSRLQLPGPLFSFFDGSSCTRGSKRLRWLHLWHDRGAGQEGFGLFPIYRVTLWRFVVSQL